MNVSFVQTFATYVYDMYVDVCYPTFIAAGHVDLQFIITNRFPSNVTN